MKRRGFFKKSAQTVVALGVLGGFRFMPTLAQPKPVFTASKKTKTLTAYYFRAHMYTLVPAQIEADMAYMASIGTRFVALAILEQDLFAAVENVDLIAKAAAKHGMKLLMVPSRWGGLVAGAPKVPSLFSVQHPDTWALGSDLKPYKSGVSGVISSIYHPKTAEFVADHLKKSFELWDLAGVIWDEPKIFFMDHHPLAQKATGNSWDLHLTHCANFFAQANKVVKQLKPNAITNLFVYAQCDDDILDKMASIENLDYFGADGRPYPETAGGTAEAGGKSLVDQGERFKKICQQKHKKLLYLIENHNMPKEDNLLMDKHLPEVLQQQPEHVIYYYYPRNIEKPEENMAIIKKHLKNWL